MKKNIKMDRTKFVQSVTDYIKEKGGALEEPVFNVNWEKYRIGDLTVTIYGQSDHEHLYSVFVRTDCPDKNFHDNGKRNFHLSPCNPDYAIDMFRAHLNELLKWR